MTKVLSFLTQTRQKTPECLCTQHGGTHVVLGDASIQFLSSNMDPQAFIALVTPAQNDEVPAF